MKQILQNLKSGQTSLVDVPNPAAQRGSLLIRTRRTLLSVGTERILVDFGRANLIEKARQQPDKVRQVLEKIKTDGVMPTFQAVRNKLDQPLALGYCNAGVVVEVGAGVEEFRVGDRVVSNGKHAEMVAVTKNLCAHIPDNVSDEAASFTVIGAIALQGIRLVAPTLGETVAVVGLGLIGLMTVQLLRAHGCRVVGFDFERDKVDLAIRFGAEAYDLSSGIDLVSTAVGMSRGRGVDAVIITASTKSSDPVHQAAQMCRKRGRIVLVGVVGLELSRADFYEKELSFQVSCSYGPGRYDPSYEEGGNDYPIGFVRWTEQRNFEAVLDMMADGRLDVAPLITHRFPFERATEAYQLISDRVPCLGVVLEYPRESKSLEEVSRRSVTVNPPSAAPSKAVIGFIGSGNYGTQVLIPAFKVTGARLKTVVSSQGVSGVHAASRNGIEEASTDAGSAIADPEVDTVVISTRHDSHAGYVVKALAAGKHVFVEKPLALTREEIRDIERVYRDVNGLAEGNEGSVPLTPALSHEGRGGKILMVGFNRRFAPQVVKLKSMLAAVSEPKAFVMTVNAGAISPEHWTQQRAVGGGRIIGEGCHFIDLLRHLAGSRIRSVNGVCLEVPGGIREDKATLVLKFEDGSVGTIHYLANGHKSFPKERLEVFCAGRIVQLDNFRRMKAYGWPDFSKMNLWRQDKGQKACVAAFVNAIETGGPSPIPYDELIEVAEATIAADEALRS